MSIKDEVLLPCLLPPVCPQGLSEAGQLPPGPTALPQPRTASVPQGCRLFWRQTMLPQRLRPGLPKPYQRLILVSDPWLQASEWGSQQEDMAMGSPGPATQTVPLLPAAVPTLRKILICGHFPYSPSSPGFSSWAQGPYPNLKGFLSPCPLPHSASCPSSHLLSYLSVQVFLPPKMPNSGGPSLESWALPQAAHPPRMYVPNTSLFKYSHHGLCHTCRIAS